MEAATLRKTENHPSTFQTSVLGASWEVQSPLQKDVVTLVQKLEIPEIVARLILNRGISIEQAFDFIEPTIRNLLPDPFHLLDMDKAAERTAKAVIKHENIAIFGDYDVDGATSSALLARFFRAMGIVASVYIPDRISEGYGLNSEALLKLRDGGADLVITVDCGTNSFEPIKIAQDAGLDVIVVDHHMSAEELPEAVAVINPNRLDEVSEHRNLAAVGVAFLFAVAVRRILREKGFYQAKPPEPDLLKWLDIVALGTVCDIVPLTGVNRAFVARGLEIMRHRNNLGLATLADVAGVTSAPDVYHAGFIIGPRINAGGRVGKSDLGSKLLLTEDRQEAMEISQELDKLNRERKAIEKDVLEEALAIAQEIDQKVPFLCVAKEGWHPGVIGIVASRLKEKFNRPTAIVAIENGVGKASVRSISGVDIGAAITSAKMAGLLLDGGGHKMAAGFTVEVEKLPELQNFINERIAKDVAVSSATNILKLDGILSASSITTEIAKALRLADPYGIGNREPKFAITNAKIIKSDIVGGEHVRCIIGDGGPNPDPHAKIKAIAFRAHDTRLGKELLCGYGHQLHLAGKIKLDSWQGVERAELIIEDAVTL